MAVKFLHRSTQFGFVTLGEEPWPPGNLLESNEANQSSIFLVNAEVSYIQYISIPAGRSLIVHFDSFAGLLSP